MIQDDPASENTLEIFGMTASATCCEWLHSGGMADVGWRLLVLVAGVFLSLLSFTSRLNCFVFQPVPSFLCQFVVVLLELMQESRSRQFLLYCRTEPRFESFIETGFRTELQQNSGFDCVVYHQFVLNSFEFEYRLW